MRDDLLQKVIEEAFKTWQAPFFGAHDLVDEFLRFTAVVNQYDPFFIQREGKGFAATGKPLSVGNVEGSGQRIKIDLCLGGVDRRDIRLDINAHVEDVLLQRPFLRTENRDILRRCALDLFLWYFR